MLSDGDMIRLMRGENHAQGRSFSLTTEAGRVIEGRLPGYNQPNVKTAAGYYVADDMDMIDLFIGMEGTLGVITEIELRLIPRPPAINGLTMFLPSEEAALKLVRVLRGEEVEGFEPAAGAPRRHRVLQPRRAGPAAPHEGRLPRVREDPGAQADFHTALYTEFHGESDDELEEAVMQVMEAITALGVER